VYFGLPERSFNSFYQAANEAAISRLMENHFGMLRRRSDSGEEGWKAGVGETFEIGK